MRASDEDRARVLRRLGEHYVAGRLSGDEHVTRSDAAAEAARGKSSMRSSPTSRSAVRARCGSTRWGSPSARSCCSPRGGSRATTRRSRPTKAPATLGGLGRPGLGRAARSPRRPAEAAAATASRPDLDALTPREREILDLVAQGQANKEIAAALGISERTARTHVSHVLRKLGVSSRTQAALIVNRADSR